MKVRRVWSSAALFALALTLTLFTPVTQAATEVVDTELGGTFTGAIDTPGVDFVQGRFMAAGGEEIRLTAWAVNGSTLTPTAAIFNSGGASVAGFSRSIGWMGFGNVIHMFTIPAAGTYFAEVGGSSGSGNFEAHLTGSPVASNLVLVSGNITDSLTLNPIAGATVTVEGSAFATSDGSGNFSGHLDPGTYAFAFMASGYTTQGQAVTVSAGSPINDLDIALNPDIAVLISASASGDMTPGGVVTAMVDITAPAGTTINSITWTQHAGATALIVDGDTAIATVTLAGATGYKDELIHHLEEPPVSADQLPPNVPLPPGHFPAGLQDRLEVVGINPLALEEAALIVLEVEVDTDQGVFTDEVEVHADVAFAVGTGLRNVPRDVAVLLRAKEHTSYDWILSPPPGSSAMLSDATTRHPHFIPDMPGLYELSLAEVPAGSDMLEVYAGTFRGIIVDQDINGRPVPDTACTFCHNDAFAPDKFTDWAQTGHAEIFTNNLNTSTHYGPNCFACHAVGFDHGSDNGGVDEASDYQDFLASGLLNNPGDNWTEVLAQFPETARMANIQCENCHGPQDSFAHGFAGPLGDPRVDLSADVCASCHGEPLRHARFQQWQLSGHANYELAIDESGSGSCSRCHTANGFLEWLPILLDNDPTTDPLANITVTWTEDEAHPQTCATCHDPHAIGTTTGIDTNATVRISGDTPPLIAGFQVTDVGRGAICMTCHNSRRGLRNDSVWDTFSASEKARAPHGSAQTDVLVGENAYFVPVGDRGSHSFLEDACVSCHMESTPPPSVLSYNQGGTNHTFLADRNICSDCHSPHLDPDDVQGGVQHLMDIVEDLLEDGYYELFETVTTAGNSVDLNGDATISDPTTIAEIQFGEYHGRQALSVTFNDMSVSGPHRLTDIDVLDGSMAIVGTLADFADDSLMKSGWNWALIHNDGSRGVHNPFFANGALIAARDALVAMATPSALESLQELRPGTVGSPYQKWFKSRRGPRK
jgi:hypothetical protein